MLSSIFSVGVLQSALELGCIYALVALALFLSYSILNIADLSTDGCFTLGCAVCNTLMEKILASINHNSYLSLGGGTAPRPVIRIPRR